MMDEFSTQIASHNHKKEQSNSPCDPLISNVRHRVFLLLPMMESACDGKFQEVSRKYHL
jgi:hypothetical protein